MAGASSNTKLVAEVALVFIPNSKSLSLPLIGEVLFCFVFLPSVKMFLRRGLLKQSTGVQTVIIFASLTC